METPHIHHVAAPGPSPEIPCSTPQRPGDVTEICSLACLPGTPGLLDFGPWTSFEFLLDLTNSIAPEWLLSAHYASMVRTLCLPPFLPRAHSETTWFCSIDDGRGSVHSRESPSRMRRGNAPAGGSIFCE